MPHDKQALYFVFSLNRNIENVNAKTTILTNTLPAATATKTIPYPTGFTSSNCVIASVCFYNSTLGWMTLPGDYTVYAEISLAGAGVRLKTISTGMVNASIKIMLSK